MTYRKDSLLKKEEPLNKHFFTGMTGTDTKGLREEEDDDELPVAGCEGTQKQRRQTRSDDLSVLWHELLSPLTVIKGYTSTLLELNRAITEEQKEQYIRGIESANNRVIRLLENLRDVSQLEEPDTISVQPVSLLDLLRQIVSEMQSQTKKHIIKILPSARLPRIKADPEKIEQVISNLLVNAIKYSPQGGDIEVGIRMAQSEQELKRMFGDTPPLKLPGLIISVSDNGIGIPEADMERIFERFYRVDNRLTRVTPGIGLGLYICKIIVEAHGGHIWATSRPGGGSILRFSLPYA
jgi:signal transduction histidine kinase